MGALRFRRRLYRCARCGREHAWLDAKLGMVGAQTGGTAQLSALLTVDMPERGAVRRLKELCGVGLGATTAWRNRQRLGSRMRPILDARSEQWLAAVGPDQSAPKVQAPGTELIVREADAVDGALPRRLA